MSNDRNKYRAVEHAPAPAVLKQAKRGQRESPKMESNMPYERTNARKTRS